jgi:hypothetical protein
VAGTGCSIQVKDSVAKANGIEIKVTYSDPESGELKGETMMNVKALPPVSVHIQTAQEPKNKDSKNLSDDIYFGAGDEEVRVYAVLRDKYGNFAGYADIKSRQSGDNNNWWSTDAAVWTSEAPAVATVNPRSGRSTVVHREPMGAGTQTVLTVSYRVCWVRSNRDTCATLYDTVNVGSPPPHRVTSGNYISSNGYITYLSLTFDQAVSPDIFWGVDFSFGPLSMSMRADVTSCVSMNQINPRNLAIRFDCAFSGTPIPASMGNSSAVTLHYNGGSSQTLAIVNGAISVLSTGYVIPNPPKPPERFAAAAPANQPAGGLTAGPNPADKTSGAVIFFRQGSRVRPTTLSIYDADGNIVKKIGVNDNAAIGNNDRRAVGSWDLTDRKGRKAAEGAYLVKGTIKAKNGKGEKVSIIVGTH